IIGALGTAAEHFTSQINSGRSHGVTSAVADRRVRLFNKQPGEVAMYDAPANFSPGQLGKWFYFQATRALLRVPNDQSIYHQVDQHQQQGQQAGSTGAQGAGGQQQTGQDATQVPQALNSFEQNKDHIQWTFGQATLTITSSYIEMKFGSSASVKVDANHAHLEFGGNVFWADKNGTWTEPPPNEKADPYDSAS
ncbi:MAG: hypothetical protein ACRELF_14620, partial [Gemmataceae bacterium]